MYEGLQATELRESLEERKRESAERYRAQATRVFTGARWHAGEGQPDYFSLRVVNVSDFPAYDAQVWYSVEPSSPLDLGTVLPGESTDVERGSGWSGFRSAQEAIQIAVLTFRDAAGVRWLRMPDGTAVLRDATHWDEVVTKLGYDYLRRHDLRHTGLTWMADAGVPVHVLRKIAGHGSLTTTQRYLHPDQRSILDAGQALSAHLGAS
jgi:Phage integrase family